jgi:threonine synthase
VVDGDDVTAHVGAKTIADSICVGVPAAGRWAKRAIRETGGAGLLVPDDEIAQAIGRLGRSTGLFAEPAAATAIAGVAQAARRGLVQRGETVVALVTGTGLKDVAAAGRAVTMPEPIAPTLEALRARIAAS